MINRRAFLLGIPAAGFAGLVGKERPYRWKKYSMTISMGEFTEAVTKALKENQERVKAVLLQSNPLFGKFK